MPLLVELHGLLAARCSTASGVTEQGLTRVVVFAAGNDARR